jgi:hypothetical protein
MTVVVVVWTIVLLLLTAAVMFDYPPTLRHWLFTTVRDWVDIERPWAGIAALVSSTVAVGLVMVTIHEGGHVLCGVAAGFRFKSIRVGPLLFDRSSGLTWRNGPGNPFAGVAVVVPDSTDRLVPRGMLMLAGGPAANLLTGGLALLLTPAPGFVALVFIVQSIGNGLSDLLPYRSVLGVSDGAFLWALWRHPARAERWLALMKLNADSMDGVLPESLPAAFIAKAIAIPDDSIDTVGAHAFAYANAFHQRRDAEAAGYLEVCLSRAGHAPARLREALMSDAAVFQARRRRRVDLAEAWLADLPATTVPWLRSRAEAATLEARGDVPGALEKLEECRRGVAALANPVQRTYVLRLLERWKTELSAA